MGSISPLSLTSCVCRCRFRDPPPSHGLSLGVELGQRCLVGVWAETQDSEALQKLPKHLFPPREKIQSFGHIPRKDNYLKALRMPGLSLQACCF